MVGLNSRILCILLRFNFSTSMFFSQGFIRHLSEPEGSYDIGSVHLSVRLSIYLEF